MDANPETCRLLLDGLLRKEVALTERFASLLSDEYASIARRDIEALERLIEDKTRMLEQLAALERERTSTLTGAGFDPGQDGMPACLRWCDPQRISQPLWDTLQARARSCAELNRRNQQLVDMCSRHAREVLYVLRGEESGQSTYAADGETQHRHSNRTLAKV